MERLPIKILQSMFDHKKYADIELIAGADGKRISAHKIVLSYATEYFDLMLNGSFREATESEVLIPHIESDVLKAVIKFIYYGSVKISNYRFAIELLKTAHFMKIPELLNYSSDYLKQHISVEIYLEAYLLSRMLEVEDLTKHVTFTILKNLKSFTKQNEFKQLDKESFVEIINSRNLSICEDEIAEAVLIWIGDDEDRLPYYKEFLKLLEINRLKEQFVIHQLLERCGDQDETIFILNERKSPKKLKLICIEKESPKYIFYEYDPETRRRSFIYKAYDYGPILGLWDDKVVFLKHLIITVVDIKIRSVSGPIRCSGLSTSVDFENPHKIGSHIYLLDRYNFFKLHLWDFKLEMITPPENEYKYIFDTFYEFHGELKIAALKKNDPNICVIISYNPENDSWGYGSEVRLIQLNGIGTMVAHDNRLYYFKREFLYIYNLFKRVWDVPIKLEQLTYKGVFDTYNSIHQAYSINGQLIVRNRHNKIFKYSKGKLIKLDINHNKINKILQY